MRSSRRFPAGSVAAGLLFLAAWIPASLHPPWARAAADSWAATGEAAPRYVGGQIVVLLRRGVTSARLDEINRSQGTRTLGTLKPFNLHLLAIPKNLTPPQAARRFRALPEVMAADPNYVTRAASNDPLFAQQWYFENVATNPGNAWDNLGFIDADIDAPGAWLAGSGASNVRIAILDTGIDATHPDLKKKVVAATNFTATAKGSHGTHVAGLAAARTNNNQFIAGVCPLCSLLDAQVLSATGVGNLWWLQQGISWAVSNGAKILNASLAGNGACPTTLQPLIDALVQPPTDAVFVAAAGNNGNNLNNAATQEWPAVCNHVVTVAATNARDDRAPFSNWGAPLVEIAAPGADVLSLLPGASSGRSSGTSMAAPMVSGSIGVLWAKLGLATPSTAVIQQLLTSADPIDGTAGYPGYAPNSNSWQAGRLNLCRALGQAACDPPNPKPAIPSALDNAGNPACPSPAGLVSLDLSTGSTQGIDDPFGATDSKWRLVEVPSSSHAQLPGNFPIGFYPATSVNPAFVPWIADPAGANWISPLHTPIAQSNGFWLISSRGFYRYRLLFQLPPGTYASASLTGVHAEDDQAEFFLNGNKIVPGATNVAGGFATLTPFSYSASGLGFFKTGTNELDVKVENTQSITGLLVSARLRASCGP